MTAPASPPGLDPIAELAIAARANRAALAASAQARVLDQLALNPATRRNLEAGTLAAVDRFVDVLEDPDRPLDVELYAAHGRAHCAAGRSITELLAFYRLSGLAMWEKIEELPGSERLTGAQALELGSRMLRLLEQLTVAALDGFLEAGAEQRRRDRARRDRLRSLLLSDPPESLAAIEGAAARADWPLPQRVRAAVAALPLEADAADQERAPARVLCGPHSGGRIVLVVGAGEDAESLLQRAAAAHGAHAVLAVGPVVPVQEAARSAQRAAGLLDQIEAGAVPAAAVVRTDDHELPLLLAAAPELVASLVERRLAPVSGLTPAKREQALETLAAWLAEPHRPQAIADRLGMHVQSVRYRLTRLRELFGEALDDPEARFELQVALRAERGRAPGAAD
jgi:DNA-binding PucR family transcriptional regulator